MTKAPSKWCFANVLEVRGQRTREHKKCMESVLSAIHSTQNNRVKAAPGREAGECSPSAYPHLELASQALKPLLGIFTFILSHMVFPMPLSLQVSSFPDGSTPQLLGLGGKFHRMTRQGLSWSVARNQEDS